jgi:four helix bundle protein
MGRHNDDLLDMPQERIRIVPRSFAFALRVVKLCRELDGKPGVSRVLAIQLLKAGTSIGANVEEAQAGQSKADFISKNAIALKEARETRYWLRLVADSELIDRKMIEPLIEESAALSRILGAIVSRARERSAL